MELVNNYDELKNWLDEKEIFEVELATYGSHFFYSIRECSNAVKLKTGKMYEIYRVYLNHDRTLSRKKGSAIDLESLKKYFDNWQERKVENGLTLAQAKRKGYPDRTMLSFKQIKAWAKKTGNEDVINKLLSDMKK